MSIELQRIHTKCKAGHVPTFLKSFCSVLERGPSDRSFRSRSFFFNRSVLVLVPLQIVPIFLISRSMRSFFFRNDGIVLDRSVRSRERTIVPQERRPALVVYRASNFFIRITKHYIDNPF